MMLQYVLQLDPEHPSFYKTHLASLVELCREDICRRGVLWGRRVELWVNKPRFVPASIYAAPNVYHRRFKAFSNMPN